MRIRRFPANPIIRPDMDPRMGDNINGPSLVRVPDWLPTLLGRYYLYFAHHKGTYIRLAHADSLEGPWTTYEPGTLKREDAFVDDHIASPDVDVDHERREIRMYYHGVVSSAGDQRSKVATSRDGITFDARPDILGNSYFRIFRWGGFYYALGMPGVLYRSRDGLGGFETGPTLFGPSMRHCALKLDGDVLRVFYSNAGDRPEAILHSHIDLKPDWREWRESQPVTVLEPETDYEGADLPLAPSLRGLVRERVHQLRDPAVFEGDGRTYLLYSVAGEHGIGMAELLDL